MKKILFSIGVVVTSMSIFVACQNSDSPSAAPSSKEISPEIAAKVKSLGFGTSTLIKTEDGYIVEGDINLSEDFLSSTTSSELLRVGEEEQYRTTNLVTGLPRTIKVKVSGLGTAFVQGTDLAISRYNALGLRITFQRITSGTANITIQGFNEGPSGGFITLGSSGFPSGGNPYGTVKMNTNSAAYGSNPNVSYVGSVIQHEIGHCIGFRHTDYSNRAYSCGGSAVNEGSSGIGAINIPGTPTGPDPNSWMLSCSNGGNRTFNSNDKIALNYLY